MSTADTQQVPKARGSAGQPGGRTVLLVTISLDTIKNNDNCMSEIVTSKK